MFTVCLTNDSLCDLLEQSVKVHVTSNFEFELSKSLTSQNLKQQQQI